MKPKAALPNAITFLFEWHKSFPFVPQPKPTDPYTLLCTRKAALRRDGTLDITGWLVG